MEVPSVLNHILYDPCPQQITNGIVATPHIPYLLPHSHASRSSRHAHTLALHHSTYAGQTILNILTSLIQ